jgi:hypothetical protein
VKKTQKTKIILLFIAVTLVVMAAVDVTYTQYVNAQQNSTDFRQTPPQGYNSNYGYLPPNNGTGYYNQYQQGTYPNVAQGPYPYGYGRMGMCERYW